mmetsp:Transcript_12936/g.19083  ORF Transcript_12936/g.19083 Transcript_12936/m.19083 type:complete len:200 (+) Transcript_12936:881-1480(+)
MSGVVNGTSPSRRGLLAVLIRSKARGGDCWKGTTTPSSSAVVSSTSGCCCCSTGNAASNNDARDGSFLSSSSAGVGGLSSSSAEGFSRFESRLVSDICGVSSDICGDDCFFFVFLAGSFFFAFDLSLVDNRLLCLFFECVDFAGFGLSSASVFGCFLGRPLPPPRLPFQTKPISSSCRIRSAVSIFDFCPARKRFLSRR